MRVFAFRRGEPETTHHFFDTDIAVAPRQVSDVYRDLRLLLWKALAHVRVIEHEPEVRLEEVDTIWVLRVRGGGQQRE
jgi:hypothetical protein